MGPLTRYRGSDAPPRKWWRSANGRPTQPRRSTWVLQGRQEYKTCPFCCCWCCCWCWCCWWWWWCFLGGWRTFWLTQVVWVCVGLGLVNVREGSMAWASVWLLGAGKKIAFRCGFVSKVWNPTLLVLLVQVGGGELFGLWVGLLSLAIVGTKPFVFANTSPQEQKHTGSITPAKFNIAPEKWWLEDYFTIGKVTFQGLC